MSLLLRVLMAIAALSVFYTEVSAFNNALWPQPQSAQLGTGVLTLGPHFSFVVNSGNSLTEEASSLLKKSFSRYEGYIRSSAPVSSVGLSTCTINVTDGVVPKEVTHTDESYTINVDESGHCEISSTNVWGAFRGLETFTQLLSRKTKDDATVLTGTPVQITDAPRYGHRGLMIDTARHYEPLSEIRRVISSLPASKFNVLHWHIVDAESFPLNMPSEPTMINGAFSPSMTYELEDLRDIQAYAREHGVDIIFELDMPGHANGWRPGKEEILADCFSKYTNVNNYALNPAKEETYTTIQNLLGDLITATGVTRVHLGGDEVIYGCWNNDTSVIEFQQANNFNGDQTLSYFVDRADAIANKFGANVIHWEEVFSAGAKVPEGTIYQVWTDSSMMSKVTGAGYPTISSPSDVWYLNLLQNTWDIMYAYDPTNGLTEEQSSHVVGGETACWSEFVDEMNLEQTLYPRACAVGERLWSAPTVNDKNEAVNRLISQKCRLVNRGIKSAPVKPADYCDVYYL